MELILAVSLLLLLALIPAVLLRRIVLFEHQAGLLYTDGKYVRTLKAGRHWILRLRQTVQRVDLREATLTVPGQDVLSADHISLKLSAAAAYRVVDPYAALHRVTSYTEALYLAVQLAVRDVIGAREVDQLLAKRADVGRELLERAAGKAAALGLELKSLELKDVMLSGEMKAAFAQVVSARKEGLAALERARGESAALRNLANSARLMEETPGLRQLRLIQALEKKGAQAVVVLTPDGMAEIRPAKKETAG